MEDPSRRDFPDGLTFLLPIPGKPVMQFFCLDDRIVGCLSNGTQWSGTAEDFKHLFWLIREIELKKADVTCWEERLVGFLRGETQEHS